MSGNKIGVSDILCEFFEVAIHNILHSRKLYPDSIFTTKRKYGIVVNQSIHPDVNNYITESLKAVNFHLKKSQLKHLFVCIYSGQHIFEKFVFDIQKITNNIESDLFMIDIEEGLRKFCLRLHTSDSYLDCLPSDATFSIQLVTSEYSSLEFNENPIFEDFPWIQLSKKESELTAPDIVPLNILNLDFLTLQMYIERQCVDY